jgi:maleamate amidohydrolase
VCSNSNVKQRTISCTAPPEWCDVEEGAWSVKMKPWNGVIPDDDLAVFATGHLPEDRPITAGERPALLIVDMTLEFVDSGSPVGFSDTGYPAVEQNKRLLDAWRERSLPVYFSNIFPSPDYPGTRAEYGLWKSPDADPSPRPGDVIVDALAPREGEIVIHKGGKPSAFFGTPLASLLVVERVDTVVVTGMSTSGCVNATVIDAFSNNYRVIVPFEACADRSQISHAVGLFDMHMKYADVVSVDETLEWLAGLPQREAATV